MSRDFIKSSNLTPKQIRYAPNLSTVMLWIEAGLGVGIINQHSSIAGNPMIRVIEEVALEEAGANACFAWKKDCVNPAVDMFIRAVCDKNFVQNR